MSETDCVLKEFGNCSYYETGCSDCKVKAKIRNALSAQPEQRWIPVSERLPEEDDYKSCIECLDGAVWYFTENGTMGLGYYYKSTKEWSTTDDLKTDGKVVAWMPLPEPYKAESNEIETLDMAIKALESQEWIPCKPSELPKDKKLWVTHDRWGGRYVDEVFWDMTEWSDNVSYVVAYMPYVEPEPYMEDI